MFGEFAKNTPAPKTYLDLFYNGDLVASHQTAHEALLNAAITLQTTFSCLLAGRNTDTLANPDSNLAALHDLIMHPNENLQTLLDRAVDFKKTVTERLLVVGASINDKRTSAITAWPN